MKTAPTARGEATQRRLIDAATAEFAERGIAGARVDRIVSAARSNKAQLYAYFHSKEQLFDAVFQHHIAWLIDEVPLDGTNIAAYAVDLYDIGLRRPALVRLASWLRLERRPEGNLLTGEADAAKVEELSAAQRAGLLDNTIDPRDMLAMITAIALSWSPAALQIAAFDGEPEEVHARRRCALTTAVKRAFGPDQEPLSLHASADTQLSLRTAQQAD